jgi:VIT1/CCC1 family predicted Fe2+/Mn2+ transporter
VDAAARDASSAAGTGEVTGIRSNTAERSMPRESYHVEPRGITATARHYIRDIVYGASDGIITTFAVVSGVAGGGLPHLAVLVVGAANLAADGVSMGAGNLLSIRADERARAAARLPELETFPWKHGLATMIAFMAGGVIPLLPYALSGVQNELVWAFVLTFAALFAVGVARAALTGERWWAAGCETLAVGAVVAATAYLAGMTASALGAG